MQQDQKKLAIIILAVALVIVTGLWLRERNQPASFEDFKQAIIEEREKVDEACADTSTDEGREDCTEALENLNTLLESLK